ncbi:MAG: peptidylprolyl isomerase [Acidobacteriota bacterium]|nr:peptidylprolyl isomerase [Acidobacteriota bacterium]
MKILIPLLMILTGCATKEVSAPTAAPKKTGPAPAEFKVKFDTNRGAFVVEVHREWAPNGADRIYELVENKFYDDARFFRVVRDFVVQWGINKSPDIEALWRQLQIIDDRVKQSNLRGYVTFATAGPNTRTTQVFVNLKNNAQLDGQGFAPFGKVTEGMEVVDDLYGGYGDQPQQNMIERQGNQYLESTFPKLDYIKTARVVQ